MDLQDLQIGNEFIGSLLNNDQFRKGMSERLGIDDILSKADTISQATNLLWYDLSPVVQMLYPYKQLIPLISTIPRVPADGGNAFHWKRITAINPNGVSSGVSEGNRGARIAITEQDMMAVFRTLGYESSVTFEARLGAKNLRSETLGLSVQAGLRSLMIDEEKILVNGNATMRLGITPTPTLVAGTVTGHAGSFSGAVYVGCVALTGFGYLGYRTYNSTTGLGGVPGQQTKVNADGSSDTYGGGSAAPSAIATVTPTGAQAITATVTPVVGAQAYAWFLGSTVSSPGTMYLAGMTPSNQVVLTTVPASTAQPLSSLYVAGNPTDNSINALLPDGIIPQIFGAITGAAPGTQMATNPLLATGTTLTAGGSVIYNMASGNTGLTINGSDIAEFDLLLRTAWEQYKIGYNRILMSAADMVDTFGTMLSKSGANYRILFDADETTGRIIAGRKVTAYMNKFTNDVLDVEVHPYLTPGTIIFWSDRSPYELSGVNNLIEAVVRQDYYQIQWPWRTRRYEYGVYVDECFPMYFTPGFGMITNKNPASGNFAY